MRCIVCDRHLNLMKRKMLFLQKDAWRKI